MHAGFSMCSLNTYSRFSFLAGSRKDEMDSYAKLTEFLNFLSVCLVAS